MEEGSKNSLSLRMWSPLLCRPRWLRMNFNHANVQRRKQNHVHVGPLRGDNMFELA